MNTNNNITPALNLTDGGYLESYPVPQVLTKAHQLPELKGQLTLEWLIFYSDYLEALIKNKKIIPFSVRYGANKYLQLKADILYAEQKQRSLQLEADLQARVG